MPVYVLYEGRLIEKRYKPSKPQHAASDLPAPAVQSFESYSSPIDDSSLTPCPIRRSHGSGGPRRSTTSWDSRPSPARCAAVMAVVLLGS